MVDVAVLERPVVVASRSEVSEARLSNKRRPDETVDEDPGDVADAEADVAGSLSEERAGFDGEAALSDLSSEYLLPGGVALLLTSA